MSSGNRYSLVYKYRNNVAIKHLLCCPLIILIQDYIYEMTTVANVKVAKGSDVICCQDILEKDETEPGEMMECLIKHKHHADMNQKCAAGVMHHQLVSLDIIRA